jgi:hypothetical protein
MTDDRKSGALLIAGSLGGVLTMAIHPTGAGALTADQIAHLSLVSALAHSLALLSLLLLFLGGCGLTRRLAAAARTPDPDRLAFAGVVTFGFACVACMIAAAVSGFIVPGILRHMVRDAAAVAPQYHLVIDAVFQFNQAFARIYAIAASGAIALWSVSALRNGGLARGIAIYGCIAAVLLTAAVATGHLHLDVHGMAAVMVGHVIWFIAAGIQLYRGKDPALPAADEMSGRP